MPKVISVDGKHQGTRADVRVYRAAAIGPHEGIPVAISFTEKPIGSNLMWIELSVVNWRMQVKFWTMFCETKTSLK